MSDSDMVPPVSDPPWQVERVPRHRRGRWRWTLELPDHTYVGYERTKWRANQRARRAWERLDGA